MKLHIQDTFNKLLPADKNRNNTRRQVEESCFSFVTPRVPTNPSLLHVSPEMVSNLGMTNDDVKSEEFLKIFSGAQKIEGTDSYAMCYGGHQFGNWAGQLGDGRAINLGEVVHNEKRWAIQLKGSGETPYSRTADGLAVLRSSVREHLCSEAMHHLGVPTTRSLSLCLTGDKVMRDVMYDGNPALEKGAVVCRVAPSFIRFGNFEIFASRGDTTRLQQLADYTIEHFYPEIKTDGKDKYTAFFNAVVQRTLETIMEWQRVGFVHGVMNTDNLSILGLTIDYGPYGWLEGYDPGWTPNTTDRQNKRYRYGNQLSIGLWNLHKLANALYPLVEVAKPFEEALENYKLKYSELYLKMMQSKLGISKGEEEDYKLIESCNAILQLSETDMTIFYRLLSQVKKENSVDEAFALVTEAFYKPEDIASEIRQHWKEWFELYLSRISISDKSDTERRAAMNKVNPKYVLRNYMSQLAIDDANKGDYNLIDTFYNLLKAPYDEQPEMEKWFAKRPEWARHKVGCSMLSCSS